MANILLIEDDYFIRDLYLRQFKLSGHTIEAREKGKEGLEAAKSMKHDIILLDIMLPEMNGLEILKEFKKDPAAKTIPVILLSNLGQEAVLEEGMKNGAYGHLIKASYTPNEIVKEVEKALNNVYPNK